MKKKLKTNFAALVIVYLIATVLSSCSQRDQNTDAYVSASVENATESYESKKSDVTRGEPKGEPKSTPTVIPTPTAIPTPTVIPTPTPVVPRTATLVFTGDILSHGPVIQRALLNGDSSTSYDYTPMFGQVRNLLGQADLAICHLETPVSSDNLSLSGYPIFNAPRELPSDLRTVGYDGCSTASNHSMDKGSDGVRSTIEQLEQAGVK